MSYAHSCHYCFSIIKLKWLWRLQNPQLACSPKSWLFYLDSVFVPTCVMFLQVYCWVTPMTVFVDSPFLNVLVSHNQINSVSHCFLIPICAIFPHIFSAFFYSSSSIASSPQLKSWSHDFFSIHSLLKLATVYIVAMLPCILWSIE